jgi:hypothetical protein
MKKIAIIFYFFIKKIKNTSKGIKNIIIHLFFILFLALSNCSTALMTVGVLDTEDQEKMFNAKNRTELESIVGRSVKSSVNNTGNKVEIYEYINGEAGVVGTKKSSLKQNRGLSLYNTLTTYGILEIFMIPAVISDRKEATSKIQVIYTSNDNILAIIQK